ncbi:MAG: alginate lyase family protein [Armatimonadota bacterium]
MSEAQTRLQSGDARLRPALDTLREEAEAALPAPLPSVMDKTLVPPSGDKHDYVSFGLYWWPNPDTPDGLPYVRRDGEVNPEFAADSDTYRMRAMLVPVETLALAFFFTGHEPYAEKAAAFLRCWFLDPDTRMHPHLQFGQGIPGRLTGRGIGIIDTHFLTRLVDAVGLLEESAAWTAGDRQGLRAWFAAYLDWLLTSDYGRDEARHPNNHGTWFRAQAAAYALFTGQPAIARDQIASTFAWIDAELAPDGAQPHELARTRSWDYSVMNLEAFARLAEMARHVELDLWGYVSPTGAGLRASTDYLAPYADPDAAWPYRQIHPINPLYGLPDHLRRAAVVYGDPQYDAWLAKLPQDGLRRRRVQLLYPA